MLLWNLAANPGFGPHTNDGGCSICEGAVTLDGDRVTRNTAYAVIAHFGRFVPPGSVRVATSGGDLPAVAFLRPDGGLTLLVANPGQTVRTVRPVMPGASAAFAVPAGGGLTILWPH